MSRNDKLELPALLQNSISNQNFKTIQHSNMSSHYPKNMQLGMRNFNSKLNEIRKEKVIENRLKNNSNNNLNFGNSILI
jgi:hypothetical protein